MIVVAGSSNTDMVVKTNRFPQAGETILGGEFFMFPGGKGANQAVAAARLGSKVVFISKTGNDIFGKQAVEGYKRESIDTRFIFTDEQLASGTALITVNNEGQNTIVSAPGANYSLNIDDIDKAGAVIDEADIILLQLEIPLPVVEYVIGLAAKKRKRVILNPAPAQLIADKIYSQLYAVTPNETEAEILTGVKVTDRGSAEKAVKKFIERGVKNIIITMGPAGAYLYTNEFEGMIEAPLVKAVDTTAAGDVFNGALAAALEKGMQWKDAASFACRAASLSVTKMGAQASAPFLHELV
jgi:ribokinase